MRTIYNLVFGLGFLLSAPFYFFKLWRRGGWQEGFLERFGSYSSKIKQALTNRRVVWVHGVSVGEAGLAVVLVRALEERMPNHKFVVSTTTSTGMGELRRRLPQGIEKVYYPIDRRPWVRRATAVLRPEAIVLVEAELWPNMLWHARRRGVPVFLVNARISERSFRRYRRFGFLFRDLFRGLAGVTAQNERDAARLVELGCRPERVHSVGSLKFEATRTGEQRALDVPRLLRQAGMPAGARVLLAGSTHEGEEAIMAAAFRRLRARHPDLYLVIVPRHFERARQVGAQLQKAGLKYVYRSEVSFAATPEPGSSDCLLVNSTGELRQFYPHATVVFVGKSLAGRGGQNPIEPAEAGRAIVFGPHMQNFPDIAARLVEAEAAIQVEDEKGLEATFDRLFADESLRSRLGANASKVVETNRGALGRTVEMLLRTVEP
jgi:3-deoxy-D-manno-octulosonic-acid transferase